MSTAVTIYFAIGLILGLITLHERGKSRENTLFDCIGLPFFTMFVWFPALVLLIVIALKKD